MKKSTNTKTLIAKILVSVCEASAKVGKKSASIIGFHQPKEPNWNMLDKKK